MKVTLNWLRQYVDFDWSPAELGERLTMLGLEVEGIDKISGEFTDIVIAEVLTREKHPNADRLALCRVNDGTQERQIVCGATNFNTGDKVALALPGCEMPAAPGEKPFKIKVGKIRGCESEGMMCSPKELGISSDAEGLLILPGDARIGQPFGEHLGRSGSDVVYDLEVTPNRPDWNSVIGIAREICALTGNPLHLPEIPKFLPSDENTADLVAVRLNEPKLCPRYTARVIRGVKIGPSPDWLQSTLERCGIRTINNVVDATNYVMLETGQPLHAFDYHLMERHGDNLPTIVIRCSSEGETFTTLDGQERKLPPSSLMIADETKGVALAGVMGGLNSEINNETSDVLIECAYFQPRNIRATSKQLGLRTDASYRFERGCDPNICDWASRRAAQLILETAGGTPAVGVVDAYPNVVEPVEIQLRFGRTNQLLGISITPEEQVRHLKNLGLELIGSANDEAVTFRAPTFRVDLKREEDLIEEVTRIYGVDRIPATPPRGCVGTHDYDVTHDQFDKVRRLLTGMGAFEAQCQTLVSNEAATLLETEAVALENPLSSDQNLLRSSLLPGLVNSLQHNANHQVLAAALFEIGRVFRVVETEPAEGWRLGIALTGRRMAPFWEGPNREDLFEFADLKGILDELADQLGLNGLVLGRDEKPNKFFIESANIKLGNQPLGKIGQLAPPLALRHDLRHPVFLAELDLGTMLARCTSKRRHSALPAFPGSRRDIAMLVNEQTTHLQVIHSVHKAKPAHLQKIELFDVYRGKNVEAGQKSIAYAFHYRNSDRTLTDKEIDLAHENLIERLRQDLKATIRA